MNRSIVSLVPRVLLDSKVPWWIVVTWFRFIAQILGNFANLGNFILTFFRTNFNLTFFQINFNLTFFRAFVNLTFFRTFVNLTFFRTDESSFSSMSLDVGSPSDAPIRWSDGTILVPVVDCVVQRLTQGRRQLPRHSAIATSRLMCPHYCRYVPHYSCLFRVFFLMFQFLNYCHFSYLKQ